VTWKEYADDAYHAPAVSPLLSPPEAKELKERINREKKLNRHFRQAWLDYRSGKTYGAQHTRAADTVTGLNDVDMK
jgi:hypothetical protein